MDRLIYRSFVVMAVMAINATVAAANVYECKVLDVKQIGSDGLLVETGYSRMVELSEVEFVFSSDTGLYMSEYGEKIFDVLQIGGDTNSLRALRLERGPAAVVLETLQIKTFSGGEFVFTDAYEIRSGLCEASLN